MTSYRRLAPPIIRRAPFSAPMQRPFGSRPERPLKRPRPRVLGEKRKWHARTGGHPLLHAIGTSERKPQVRASHQGLPPNYCGGVPRQLRSRAQAPRLNPTKFLLKSQRTSSQAHVLPFYKRDPLDRLATSQRVRKDPPLEFLLH